MPKETIQLSDHFTYSRLLRFVLPCIGTMLFTSIYGIVDGLCVSNFVVFVLYIFLHTLVLSALQPFLFP